MAARKPTKKRKASLDTILSTVERGFADLEGKIDRGFAAVAEDIADINIKMVTKDDLAEAVEKLDDRLTAVESKIGGIHNRIDDEALKRGDLETRAVLWRCNRFAGLFSKSAIEESAAKPRPHFDPDRAVAALARSVRSVVPNLPPPPERV